MISTLYLLILIAFQLWYFTSEQVKQVYTARYVRHIQTKPKQYRLLGGVLLVIAALLFVMRLGWVSGINAWLIGVMGVGSLVIMLTPFSYLRANTVFILYLLFFMLELFI